MANALLNVFLKFLMKIIDFLLTPLNAVLETIVPNTDSAFAKVTAFWNLLSQYSSFAMSYLGIDQEVISICILLFIPIVTIPLLVHFIKLVCKWWEVLV